MFNIRNNKLTILLLLMALITAVFWLTDLDLQAARFFYHPENKDVWYEGDNAIWSFFYQLGPVISILIAVGSIIVILFSGLKKQWNHYRIKAVFILICFLIGPGLIVNSLFKENWGRPRPAQVQELGGMEAYIPPVLYNSNGDGKSFPSGHSSVGFALIAFFFVFKKRHLTLARIALLASLLMGGLLGAARMAAGGHFLSDVLWSMFITFLVSMGLYKLFKNKLEAEADSSQSSLLSNIIISGIAFAVLAFGVFNWPLKHDSNSTINIDQFSSVMIDAGPLDVIIKTSKSPIHMTIQQHIRGFGLPTSKANLRQKKEGKVLLLKVEQEGFLTELEGQITLSVPETALGKIIQAGDITFE